MKAGDKLGPYEILAPLGEGGMGEVWKARDTRLDRTVAIKTSKSAFSERFEREARAVAALNHPNICQLYDVGPNYLVMEYVEGPHLEGPIPVEKAVEIAGQILDALDAAHRKRITHRDLKPANIIVTRQGIKLLDFGLAKLEAPLESTDATLVAAPTSRGEIVGTLQYMSPEQLQSKTVDARSDLFSFGCVLYELLTGRQAFSGESTASVIASILEREPAPANLPVPMERILKTCLDKDPDRRFQNALDLKRALHWALERSPEAAAAPQPRSPLRWAVAAAVLAAFATGLFFQLRSSKPTRTGKPLTRITRDGRSFMPALSPDGKLLAFASNRDDQYDIYVQQPGGLVPIRVTDDPADDTMPVFSADGTKIYFLSQREPAGIYEVPALGGEARLLQANARSPRPSPDGKYVALSLGRVVLKPTDGGPSRELASTNAAPLVWSPGSTELLTLASDKFVIVSLDGKSRPAPLLDNLLRRGMLHYQWSRVIAWLPDQTLLFTSPLGDSTNLWRVPISDLENGEFEPVTIGTSYNGMEAAYSSGRIAFTNNNSDNGLYSLPCDPNTGKVQGPLARLTSAHGAHPDFSSDGSLLVYSSRKSGTQTIWLRNLQTGKERMLSQPATATEILAHVVIRPDGKQIAATQNGTKGWRIVSIDSKGGDLSELSPNGARLRGWSPDGRFLILWVPERIHRISVLDVVSRTPTQIIQRSNESFSDPKLSADGKWLAFLDKDSSLYVAPFHGARPIPESEWVPVAKNASYPFWAPDGNSIYFAPPSSGAVRRELLRQPLHPQTKQPAGSPVHFYTVEGAFMTQPLMNPIAVAKDRIVLVLQEPSSDIWTMDLPDPRKDH
ncbi:MAG: protein kinase [Bryobacteraceae bacterium]